MFPNEAFCFRWTQRLVRFQCVLACLSAAVWAAQPQLPPDVLLSQIRASMTENLARLPDYTCVQSVERSHRDSSGRVLWSDRLRLQAGLAGGKVLFGWPEAGRFEERELGETAGEGTISDGNFALDAHRIFLTEAPVLTYAGEETRSGRRAVRYDYRVALPKSLYRIRAGQREATVGYRGSFWADKKTLDLVRLEVQAEEISQQLAVSESFTSVDYARGRIGDSDFLLPEASELAIKDLSGNVNLNRSRFGAFRKFTAEEVLSLQEAPAGGPAQGKSAAKIQLPAGLAFEIQLEKALDSSRAAVGDPLTGRVQGAVKQDGKVLIPKGALVSGRILRLLKRTTPVEYFVVSIAFTSLEAKGARAEMVARLAAIGAYQDPSGPSQLATSNIYNPLPRETVAELSHLSNRPYPIWEPGGEPGSLYIKGSRFQLPKDLRLGCKTEPIPEGRRR